MSRHPVPAPFGSWKSPLSAAQISTGSHPVQDARYVGEQVWWSELRSSEGGRTAIRRHNAHQQPHDVLPAPWNARSRVHEYGGGAWAADERGALVFVEFRDQRVYRLDVPLATVDAAEQGAADHEAAGAVPRPLTPADGGYRFAELALRGDRVIAVREEHRPDDTIRRDIVAIPFDGSAAEDADRILSVVAGSDFLAYPRFSPDGTRLAWIAWNHPQLPWDGTELRVAALSDGRVSGPPLRVAGSATVSVLQPEWEDADTLLAVSDASGWWNLTRIRLPKDRALSAAAVTVSAVLPEERDTGGALWNLGARWYAILGDNRALSVSTAGTDRLTITDLTITDLSGARSETVDQPLRALTLVDVRRDRALLLCGDGGVLSGLREVQLSTGKLVDLRLDLDPIADPRYLPTAEPRCFRATPDSREVHAIVYPPRNPYYQGLPGELPPFIAFVHGGPTAHSTPAVNPVFAFYTSRGIGVVDINYGGSTGYGRQYRERLRGQWGIVDVQDVIIAVLSLAEEGSADRRRLAIEGGSAGGWTVLSALTSSDVFACGVSLYGVAELAEFAAETHDFESRYLDGLIGPLPESADLYQQRAPLNSVHRVNCPVLLLQGLDDPIVPPAQAERFRDALVTKGIPHAYLAFAGESHGFRQVQTRIAVREAALSFYGQVFGFDPPGVPHLPLWRPGATPSSAAPGE